MTIRDFHYFVGETLMCCQRIEHDIKLIYAGMQAGDMDYNFEIISKKKMTLGTVVQYLKMLDRSDGKWYFADEDYVLLKQITEIRNHWAHKGYCEFIYSNNNDDFIRQARRLENDHNRLVGLSNTIEKVRFECLRKYGRID